MEQCGIQQGFARLPSPRTYANTMSFCSACNSNRCANASVCDKNHQGTPLRSGVIDCQVFNPVYLQCIVSFLGLCRLVLRSIEDWAAQQGTCDPTVNLTSLVRLSQNSYGHACSKYILYTHSEPHLYPTLHDSSRLSGYVYEQLRSYSREHS